MKRSYIGESRGDRVFNAINLTLLALITLVTLYPIYFTVIASISDPYQVVLGEVTLWPKGVQLDAYRRVFNDARVWMGYRNSAFYTLFGTLFALLLTIPGAFALSRPALVGRCVFGIYLMIPMYFGGGLIPTYLQVKALGLLDKPYTLVILGSLSLFNVVIARVFFQQSIPESLYESAQIDGATSFTLFRRIALPLSKPIIAVLALYYAVGKWNDFFTALIYLSTDSYSPLQVILRAILLLNQTAYDSIKQYSSSLSAEALVDYQKMQYIAESMKYALIFVASAPLLIAYPFVQKYFVKGVLIGSLKG